MSAATRSGGERVLRDARARDRAAGPGRRPPDPAAGAAPDARRARGCVGDTARTRMHAQWRTPEGGRGGRRLGQLRCHRLALRLRPDLRGTRARSGLPPRRSRTHAARTRLGIDVVTSAPVPSTGRRAACDPVEVSASRVSAHVHGSGPIASSPAPADIIVAMANEGAPFGPAGDPRCHLALEALESRLGRLPAAPRDAGQIALVVRRHPDKTRELLDRVDLGPGSGIPGDAWGRQAARDAEAELTVMEAPVAELIANGQPLSVFGDNLFVCLDLSGNNLPVGSRLRIGSAVLEVTAKPHNGCRKFAAR